MGNNFSFANKKEPSLNFYKTVEKPIYIYTIDANNFNLDQIQHSILKLNKQFNENINNIMYNIKYYIENENPAIVEQTDYILIRKYNVPLIQIKNNSAREAKQKYNGDIKSLYCLEFTINS